jgi:predicted kinase
MKLWILRGLPGAGKTHSCEEDLYVCSTDHFWGPDYNFDPKRLSEAHGSCFRKCIEGMQNKVKTITVDNTNISKEEISPYVLAANAYGYEHEILTFWIDPLLAWKRNTHNVPLKVVLSMYQRLIREDLPPYWNHNYEFSQGF